MEIRFLSELELTQEDYDGGSIIKAEEVGEAIRSHLRRKLGREPERIVVTVSEESIEFWCDLETAEERESENRVTEEHSEINPSPF